MAAATQTATVLRWPVATQIQSDNTAYNPLAFLSRLHHGADAAVSLARKNLALITEKNPQGWENLGTVRVSNFSTVLDTVRPALSLDAYWTVNSTYLLDGYKGLGTSSATGLIKTSRRIKDLSYLNACYVDLDSYKKGMSPDDSYSQALAHIRESGLALPSVALFSGQGCWLLWPFIEPIRAWADSTSLHLARINDNLLRRLAHLGADAQSKDAARVCRIPGSINSKSNTAVYWREIEGGSPVHLEQFAAELGVPAHRTSISLQPRKPIALRSVARMSGGYARWRTRRLDVVTLIESRGKIPEGTRYNTFFYLVAISRSAGMKYADMRREIEDLNERLCDPPLPDSKMNEAINGGLSTRKNISDARLIESLRIAPEELTGLASIGKTKRKARTRTKKSEMEERRQFISDYLSRERISIRKMVELLTARGFKVSRETVRSDYEAIDGVKKS